MSYTLLLICVVFPLWFAYRRSVSLTGVEINHVTLFTLGFLFYWVLPIAIGMMVSDFTGAGDSWSDLFGSGDFVSPYLFVALISYFAFAVGDSIAIRILRTEPRSPRRLNPAGLAICNVLVVPVLVYATITNRALLFQKYQLDISGDPARGMLAACVVLLGVIALLDISDHPNEKFRKLALKWTVFPFIAGCALLLSLGSRLTVVSFVLIFVGFRSCFVKNIPLKTAIFGTLSVAFISGTVGVLRSGLSLASIGTNLVLEPVFTSYSLIYFLRYDRMAWLHFPRYLLSDFVNLIPTSLFPGKGDLIQFPAVYAPIGALHSFVSFNFNFGIIGTVVFMFLLPIGLRWIRARSSIQLARVAYAMLSGFLAFTFFRDPFSISLVKYMMQFSLIVPAGVVAFNRFIQSCRKTGLMDAA